MYILTLKDNGGLIKEYALVDAQNYQNVITASNVNTLMQNYALENPVDETAILEASSHNPDAILLDLGLPDMDGVEIIRRVRTWSNMPIIVISARSEDSDKIEALDAGADDYLTKPFGVMELISRTKALLRRSQNMSEEKFLTLGDIVLDDEKRMVCINEKPCDLTYKEFELLKMLLQNAGIVIPREEIMVRVWGMDYEGESRTLDMHIKTLRQKLGESGSRIKTVRNVGYRME